MSTLERRCCSGFLRFRGVLSLWWRATSEPRDVLSRQMCW